MPIEKHISNKGYAHNYMPELNDWKSSTTHCLICQKEYGKHMERL